MIEEGERGKFLVQVSQLQNGAPLLGFKMALQMIAVDNKVFSNFIISLLDKYNCNLQKYLKKTAMVCKQN